MRTLAALAVTVGLIGCGGQPAAIPVAHTFTGPCPVTAPGGTLPPGSEGFNYGNGLLGVVLWPNGKLVAGRLPDGSSYAHINRDGSIEAKLGWWRAVEGRLRIEGRRLDRSAPRLRADVPAGYGPTGFQATGLTFPTRGCWKVIGRVGDARLTFVVHVVKRR